MKFFTFVAVAVLALASFSGSNASQNTLPYTSPTLSGLVTNVQIHGIKPASVHFQSEEYLNGTEFMEQCIGLTYGGSYKSFVAHLLSHSTRKFEEQTIRDLISNANDAIITFLHLYPSYTDAQFQIAQRSIRDVATLLKGKYELYATGADSKALIERVCIDLHIALCWMKAGVGRSVSRNSS